MRSHILVLILVPTAVVTGWLTPLTASAKDEVCPKSCPTGERIARYHVKAQDKTDETCAVYEFRCRCVPNSGYLLAKLAEAEAEIGRLRSANSTLVAENGQLKARIRDLEAEIGRLKAALGQKSGELNRLTAENGQLIARVSEVETEIEALRAEIDRLKAENSELRLENAELKGPHSLQLSLEYMSALRVVDPPATCATCRQRKAFPMSGTLGLKYEFRLAKGAVGLAPGILLRAGGDDSGNPFGGGGLAFELNIYPEAKRIFRIGLDVAGLAEANATVTQLNFQAGFSLGAIWAPGIGFAGGVRYLLYALNEQKNVPFVFFQFIVGIPTKSSR